MPDFYINFWTNEYADLFFTKMVEFIEAQNDHPEGFFITSAFCDHSAAAIDVLEMQSIF